MKLFLTLFGISCFFAVGFLLSWSSQEFPMEAAYQIAPKNSRDPAAIKKSYDFSHLEGSALNFAAKRRLLDGVKLIHDKKDIGIELGHFVVRGPSGQKAFACQKYGKVILSFEADGVAVNGELPKMELEGACDISSDINRIAAVWIPVSKILGEPVADGEFDFREGRAVKLKFANVVDQWPTSWMLKSLKLVDPTGENEEVSVPNEEVKKILREPFLVRW